MKKKEIKQAMKGNMVWCRNGNVCPMATPCIELLCEFKNNEKRIAKAKELKACNAFQITTVSDTWDCAAHIMPRGSGH